MQITSLVKKITRGSAILDLTLTYRRRSPKSGNDKDFGREEPYNPRVYQLNVVTTVFQVSRELTSTN